MQRSFIAIILGLATLAQPAIGGTETAGTAAPLLALQEDYPKAVHYRYANNFSAKSGKEDDAYRSWLANFGQVMGAELDRRVTREFPDRGPVIRRLKQEHPEQFLLYYQTGHILGLANPADQPVALRRYSAGHFAYLPRVRVLQDIPAEAGPTTLKVRLEPKRQRQAATCQDEDWASANPTGTFSLRPDRGDDICLYTVGPDGKPDWANAEQATLVGLDEAQGQITVKRGCYGTSPMAFRGEVFAAVHLEVVRHHGWFYNFHPACPHDAQGRQAVDLWVESYAAPLLPGGEATHFDALQLDTMVGAIWSDRGMDLDNDGRNDSPQTNAAFGVGVVDAMRRLTARLNGKLNVPDGANDGFYHVHGWEVEGLPERRDPAWRHYSETCNRLELSRFLCLEPRYTHVQHKIFNYSLSLPPGEEKGRAGYILTGKQLPFHLSRAVMSLATIHEAALTWYSGAPADEDGTYGVYDEMRLGTGKRLGWLGKPLGQPVYPAARGSNLLGGSLTHPGQFTPGEGTRILVRGQGLDLTQAERTKDLSFSFTLVTPTPDLTVLARLQGELRQHELPVKMPRTLEVTLTGDSQAAGDLLPRQTTGLRVGVLPRDGQASYRPAPGLVALETVQELPALIIGGACKPEERLFWETTAQVPAGASLTVQAFEGGTCAVEGATVGPDGQPGPFREVVAPFRQIGPTYYARTAALSPLGLAGGKVCFRFLSTGRAHWARIAVGPPDSGGNVAVGSVNTTLKGYVADQPVNQVFHFNDTPIHTPLTVTVRIAGGEPVTFERIGAYAAPGVMVREFAHGLVLCNPSPRPWEFDLATLFPGARWRRLQATPTQDLAVNNGQPVGAAVKLSPFDGLFLIRMEHDER